MWDDLPKIWAYCKKCDRVWHFTYGYQGNMNDCHVCGNKLEHITKQEADEIKARQK